MAGADHLPLKLLPARQLIGPRPPLPPMPTANFFTLGRTMMQSAFANTPRGTSLLLTIACNTVAAFLMVSSSLVLSAPNTGRLELTRSADVSKLSTTVLLRGIEIAPPFVSASIPDVTDLGSLKHRESALEVPEGGATNRPHLPGSRSVMKSEIRVAAGGSMFDSTATT